MYIEWNNLPLRRHGGEPVLRESRYPNGEDGELCLLTFPKLEKTGILRHCFTTRDGGASEGMYTSLNFRDHEGENRAHLLENFRRVARVFETTEDRYVCTIQTHTKNVRVVTEEDAGKGTTRPRDYEDVDGLVTDVPGLILAAFTSDCVPVYFADPRHRAVGIAHSGWRGTVQRISREVIRRMEVQYGTDPSDLVCAVGPSICQDCYEISDDVAEHFLAAFPGHEEEILINKHNGHWQLDLWGANRIILEEAGVPADQISVTDICTCCNAGRLFSHRATGGMRGNNMAAIMLNPAEEERQ